MSRSGFTISAVRRLGGKVEGTIPLAGAKPRVKSAAMRALADGFMSSSQGSATDYYEVLADKFELPVIIYSALGRANYANARISRLPSDASVHNALHDWWTADRVAYRMDNGAVWDATIKQAATYRLRVPSYTCGVTDEPNWSKFCAPSRGGYHSVRIMCKTKGNKCEFDGVGLAIRQLPGYSEKAQAAIELLCSGIDLPVNVK